MKNNFPLGPSQMKVGCVTVLLYYYQTPELSGIKVWTTGLVNLMMGSTAILSLF